MEAMRFCLCILALAVGSLCAAQAPETLRGKLIVRAGQAPAIETAEHRLVTLDGDDVTRKVLHDQRVNGFEVEVKGHYTAPDRFLIDPSHTRAMLVRQDGKLKMITYWCDICAIRAYTPGPCVCCQRETTLDLRDPDEK